MDTVDVLKALAEETRMRILNLLVEAGDLCVCEIETLLGLSESNASRHLTRLRQAGLCVGEKRGQWVHFRPAGYAVDRKELVWAVLRSARHDLPALAADKRRLDEYRRSPYECTTIKQWPGATRNGVGRPTGGLTR